MGPGAEFRWPRRALARLLPLPVLGALAALAHAAMPAGAAGWIYLQNVPGTHACAARLAGDEVDTMLRYDRAGVLLLIAGRPDWQARGAERISLRIDDFQAGPFTAMASDNLMILKLDDPALVRRLTHASDLYWYLPSGQYHARVTGLGRALSWLATCRSDKHPG